MPQEVALVLLAAGRSLRFGGDKLLAPLAGRPLLDYSARLGAGMEWALRLAVVESLRGERAELLRRADWELVENSDPGRGQGSSLALAAKAAEPLGCQGLLVCLADMPAVSDALLEGVLAVVGDCDAVVCVSDDYRGPPSYFAGRHLPLLMQCVGDRDGAAVIRRMEKVGVCEAPVEQVMDVDIPGDLQMFEV